VAKVKYSGKEAVPTENGGRQRQKEAVAAAVKDGAGRGRVQYKMVAAKGRKRDGKN
jgi:hypothetical protein